MKMIFHSHASKTHFHTKGCALGLILKVRVFGTRKCPIWRSLDPASRILYNSCCWSDFPSSLMIMSSVINCGSPPHKGWKLKWGSVVYPGEGPLPPPLPRLIFGPNWGPTGRKNLGGETTPRRLPFLAWGDFYARSRFARSSIPEEKWGLLVVLPNSGNTAVYSFFFWSSVLQCNSLHAFA